MLGVSVDVPGHLTHEFRALIPGDQVRVRGNVRPMRPAVSAPGVALEMVAEAITVLQRAPRGRR